LIHFYKRILDGGEEIILKLITRMAAALLYK